ncbi:hypothetical protein [Pantoea ananatis]
MDQKQTISENYSEELVIKYDGPALLEHRIDLDVLAESLQGLNSLLQEVNLVVNGTSEEFSVDVMPFQEGSFEYVIDVIQNPVEHLNILAVIGLTGTAVAAAGRTLLDILNQIEGRQIRRMILTPEGDCRIILDDGEEMIAPSYFRFLLSSTSIRKSLSKLIYKPLQKAGYTSFEIQNKTGRSLITIDESEKDNFRYKSLPVEKILVERVNREVPITFLTVHSDKGWSWRIDFNGEAVLASIEDVDFLERVRTGREPGIFSNAYIVDLIIRENLNSLEKSYIVDKVHTDF